MFPGRGVNGASRRELVRFRRLASPIALSHWNRCNQVATQVSVGMRPPARRRMPCRESECSRLVKIAHSPRRYSTQSRRLPGAIATLTRTVPLLEKILLPSRWPRPTGLPIQKPEACDGPSCRECRLSSLRTQASSLFTPVCSWEGRLFPKQPHRVRLLAPVLFADVARLRKASALPHSIGQGEACWCESSRRLFRRTIAVARSLASSASGPP